MKFSNTYRNDENESLEKKSLSESINLNESLSSTRSMIRNDQQHSLKLMSIESINETTQTVEKTESETIKYVPMNMSIYDDDPDTDWISDLKDEIDAAQSNSKSEINKRDSIRISNYMGPKSSAEIARTLNETDQKLDEILSDLIKTEKKEETSSTKLSLIKEGSESFMANDLHISRKDSIMTISSSDNQALNDLLPPPRPEHSRSFSSVASLTSVSNPEFVQVDMLFCCSNCCDLDSKTLPSKWFESSIARARASTDTMEKEKSNVYQWRVKLLDDLNERNLKEFGNIDKISILYENDVRNI